MRMRSLMMDQHHLGCINLGESVLVPYQLSASSYATEFGMLFSFKFQYTDSVYYLLKAVRLP